MKNVSVEFSHCFLLSTCFFSSFFSLSLFPLLFSVFILFSVVSLLFFLPFYFSSSPFLSFFFVRMRLPCLCLCHCFCHLSLYLSLSLSLTLLSFILFSHRSLSLPLPLISSFFTPFILYLLMLISSTNIFKNVKIRNNFSSSSRKKGLEMV